MRDDGTISPYSHAALMFPVAACRADREYTFDVLAAQIVAEATNA
jgi:hypothetical protein